MKSTKGTRGDDDTRRQVAQILAAPVPDREKLLMLLDLIDRERDRALGERLLVVDD